MGTTDRFFTKKREWSVLKDQILDYYLTPYLGKILITKRPTRIADCFAGKGRFEDGSLGSPVIIARHIGEAIENNPSADLKGIFIEKNFAAELEENLAEYGDYCKVLEGDYESSIRYFIEHHPTPNRNYFLYIDPFGIKHIAFGYFSELKALQIRSLEVLLNFNTTGFLREGLHLLKLTREIPDWAEDLDYEVDGKNSTDRMDEVAGGDYWRAILQEFQAGSLTFHEAEVKFTNDYVDVMRRLFTYVVNIPIKERSHHMPKYRLIFAGDHFDGLILMSESMNKAWRKLKSNEMGGQLYLFDDKELVALEHRPAQDLIWDELEKPTRLQDLLEALIMKHGIVYTEREYLAAIRESENTIFMVQRAQELTRTGRKAINLDYRKQKIVVSRKARQDNLF
jgi:three-Cys-motif partner protein